MRAVQLKSVISSCFATLLLLACLMMVQGCGESIFNNKDTDSNTESQDTSDSDDEGALAREYWNTDSKALSDDRNEVVYSPINGSGSAQKRTGKSGSINVELSLIEKNNDIRANGSVILDEEMSLTRHPVELIFKEIPFEADEDGITLTIDTSADDTHKEKAKLTTKTESGTLIQPAFVVTMNIIQPSQGLYTCHGTIEIKEFNTIGEFTLPIERQEENNPLAFVESTWGKKNRFFQIAYTRKQYSDQGQVKALSDRDILKLNISDTESKVLTGSEFYLPAALSPNQSAMAIDLTDAKILSNVLNNVVVEKTGMLDIVDQDGNDTNTAYRLSLAITKKFVMEAQEKSLCEASCINNCALNNKGDQRQTCETLCENSTCVVKAERYTLTASLEVDGFKTRTVMVETLERIDEVEGDGDDGFHDNFYGAEFLLSKDTTCSVTHALSMGDIEDVVQVSYDKVFLEMKVQDDGTKGLVQGQIRIPKEIYPEKGPYPTITPYITISLGTTDVNLETRNLAQDFSSLEIGTPERAGWVSTKIDKSYPTNDGELTLEEKGFLHLSVTPLSNGAQECLVEYVSDNPWTRIRISRMEVAIKDHPTEADPSATFTLVDSPRQVIICKTADEESVNNMFESDVDVTLTLCKRWKDGVELIGVKNGLLRIGHDMDCMGALSEETPPESDVDMGPEGFTLVAPLTAVFDQTEEIIDDALTINLVKLYDNEFEFQVYILTGDDRSRELIYYLPAQRVEGTGVFIQGAVE